MELLIFSDSHGRTEGMHWAIEHQVRRPDAVCFLGDGIRDAESLEYTVPRWYTVRGNCDWGILGAAYTEDLVISLEGHRILLTHGHAYGVKEGCGRLLSHAVEIGADIVLYGHTHEPMNVTVPAGTCVEGVTVPRTTYLFNPGSIGGYERSFGTLYLRGDRVLLSHGTAR